MNDAGDEYDNMPIERVDLILRRLRPEYWTPERLGGASPADKREAVRRAFTGRGRRRLRASKTIAEDPPPKSDTMSDLLPGDFAIGGQRTSELRSGDTRYDYGDLDPGVVTDAKAAATRIRSLMAEIDEAIASRAIRIGRELLVIKARLGHGHFGPWLVAEFGWSDRQARRFMRAAQGKGTYTGFRADNVDAHGESRAVALPSSIDAYMTKPETASRLYRVTLKKLDEDGCFTKQQMDALVFFEAAAGTGNFFRELPKDRRIGIDINPLAPGIIKADFLTYELTLDPSIIWGIIGNTPFRDALKFINRAARLGASFFALILPHAILRPSMRNKIDPYFECIHHEVLPEDSFLRDGQVKHSPSVFEVWVRRDTLRETIIEQTTHPDWEWLPEKRMTEATACFDEGRDSARLYRIKRARAHQGMHRRCSRFMGANRAIPSLRSGCPAGSACQFCHSLDIAPTRGGTEVHRSERPL